MKFSHKEIEKKWQEYWEKERVNETTDKMEGKENFYTLVEFPYPSGNLHVGHWYAFAVTDIYARYKRMLGYNVLYPIGFDAFGLPAENAAIKRGVNPRDWTEQNISYMSGQLKSMGASFDWSRMVKTIDPDYYKWTQWMFIQFMKAGLAEQKKVPANWCPSCKTVLANEQVINGKCERCDSEVEKKDLKQWTLKITKYADRLIDDLDELDWPEEIKKAQKEWIGRSYGATIEFPIIFKSATDNFGKDIDASEQNPPHNFSQNYADNTQNDAEGGLLYEDITYKIRAAIFDVKKELGLGHKESVYHKALKKAFEKQGLSFESEKQIDVFYEGEKVGTYVPDFIVENKVLIELKAVPKLGKQQLNQFWTYLKGSEYRLGLLVNFSPLDLEIKRVVYDTARGLPRSSASVLRESATSIEVFTTRPDTIFGATYMVLAPEHELVKKWLEEGLIENKEEVENYIKEAKKKSEIERTNTEKEKTGVELKGVVAINPAIAKAIAEGIPRESAISDLEEAEIPVFIADYVLAHYGTGAIMAVPAHDERDYAFASRINADATRNNADNTQTNAEKIKIRQVIAPLLKDEVKEDKETAKKDTVIVIATNEPEENVLVLDWEKYGWHSFIIGELQKGESYEEAAIRKAKEESGYDKVELVGQVGYEVHSSYFAEHKDLNKYAKIRAFHVKIKDTSKEPLQVEKHKALWLEKSKVAAFLNKNSYKYFWDIFVGKISNCYTEKGTLINSGEFDGLDSEETKNKIVEWLGAKKTKTYRLRDWVVSRQRYWGVPIPVVHCERCGTVPEKDENLPILLPETDDYLPSDDGQSPLAKVEDFVNTNCPVCGAPAKRETDTLDTFVDSSWYFLRYIDPENSKSFSSMEKQKLWMPVDFYSGGAEHTTMHLLYSRFWHKALFDLGLVKDKEPYERRLNRGLILGPDGNKMSKSKGNVIDPDKVVEEVGSDTVRGYLAFIGPYNEPGHYPWNPDGVVSIRKFLERVYSLKDAIKEEELSELEKLLHKTIKKVREDAERLKFNTAISAMMVFAREAQKGINKSQLESFVKLLAPFAPHLAEELWQEALGKSESVHLQEFPQYDENLAKDDSVKIGVQINGKVRAEIEISPDATEDEVKDLALSNEKIQRHLQDKEIKKFIYVPGKIVNIVV